MDYALAHVSPNRNVMAEHVQWLARLDASHEAELGGLIDGRLLQRYLATKHVLAYLNDDSWLAVHPMLREWVQARSAALAQAQAQQKPPSAAAPAA